MLIAVALLSDYTDRRRQDALLAEAARYARAAATDPTGDAVRAYLGADIERTVYPFSIVDGGIASVEELKAAMDRDPVVAEHFRNFDLARTRIQPLDKPRRAHLSYRVGDDVFWTPHQVLIPSSELILTDGEDIALTRGANQLADAPGPTALVEPPVMPDTPLVTPASADGGHKTEG